MPITINALILRAEVTQALEQAAQKALEMCGLVAEGYAIDEVPSPGKYGIGNLRNSITHKVAGNECVVGSNAPYAIYVEMGTGEPVGGSAPWVYTPDGGVTFYRTKGQPPKPFIKPAVADHADEYQQIIDDVMRNG